MWVWHPRRDALETLYRGKASLLANGQVVWGVVIQANYLLSSPGRDHCPGEVVFPSPSGLTTNPAVLVDVAQRVGELKGTLQQDPALAYISYYLSHEWTRVFGLPVPHSLCLRHACCVSTTMFFRHHLPGRVLTCPILPLISSQGEPRIVLPLPSRYWPGEFVTWWMQFQ